MNAPMRSPPAALLTPAALNIIREAVKNNTPAWQIANHLGWPIARLRSTAARFRIELIGGGDEPTPAPASARATYAPPAAAATLPDRETRGRPGPRITNAMTLDEIADALWPTQGHIFRQLMLTLDRPDFISGTLLAERTASTTGGSIGGSIYRMRGHLRDTRYDIETKFGTGYRLVTRT